VLVLAAAIAASAAFAPPITVGQTASAEGFSVKPDPVAFAGPQNVFHLVWVTPTDEVQTTMIRVECPAG
jgi:hypothetical protein